MTSMLYCFLFILMLHPQYCSAVSTCPAAILWERRATEKCDSKRYYHCLYDTNNSNISHITHQERCITTPKKYIGKKFVLSGNLDAMDCPPDRYTPKPTWSNTLAGSECPFNKSPCSEEGQIIVYNGSSKKDRSCRCNYKLGYNYVILPLDRCECEPFKEDCTCYRHHCPQQYEILSQDYECIERKNITTYKNACPEIPFQRENIAIRDFSDLSVYESSTEHDIGNNMPKRMSTFFPLILVASCFLVITIPYVTITKAGQQGMEYAKNCNNYRHSASTFYIKHKSGGKFVQPTSKKLSIYTFLVLCKKDTYEKMAFTFEPYEKEWGYLVHQASGKAVHPFFGSKEPRNNKFLVIHEDRHSAALFAIDHLRNYIVHKSGKFVHAYGGNANPSNNTHMTLHSDRHEAMKFVFVSKDDPEQPISVYPEPKISAKWVSLKTILEPAAVHTYALPYVVGKTSNVTMSSGIELEIDIDVIVNAFKVLYPLVHAHTNPSTWGDAIEQSHSITVAPGTTVATWQFQITAEQFGRKISFSSNIIRDTNGADEPNMNDFSQKENGIKEKA